MEKHDTTTEGTGLEHLVEHDPEQTVPPVNDSGVTQKFDLRLLEAEMRKHTFDRKVFEGVKRGFDEALLNRTLMDPDDQVFYYVDTKRKQDGDRVFVKKDRNGGFTFVQEDGDDDILLLMRPLGQEEPMLFDSRTVDFKTWRILTEMSEEEKERVDAFAETAHGEREAA